MWYLVAILIVDGASLSICEGIPEIIIPITTKNFNTQCDDNRFVSPELFKNKLFTISVHSDAEITTGKCFNSPSSGVNIVDHFIKADINGVYVPSNNDLIAKNMSNTLICEFEVLTCSPQAKETGNCVNDLRENNYYSSISCNIIVSYKNTDSEMGYLTVNGRPQNPHAANLKDDFFDAYLIHHFIDGQPARFACLSANKEKYMLQMSYSTNNSKKKKWNRTEEMQPGTHSTLYIKLNQEFNYGYIECTLSDIKKSKSYIIRILLRLKEPPIDLGFQVNGLILPVQLETIHVYEYNVGEKLTIQSLKDEDKYGKMKCSGKDLPTGLRNYSDWTGENISCITTLKENHAVTSLNCSIEEKSKRLFKSFSLILIPNTVPIKYYPFIKGLSMANILFEFNGTKQNTIHYEYKEEELLLTCISDKEGVSWKYHISDVENHTVPNLGTEVTIEGEFKLKADVKGSDISCTMPVKDERGELVTSVTLIRRIEGGHSILDIGGPGLNKYVVWLAPCLALLLIGIVTWVIIKLNKRRQAKAKADSTDVTYENLRSHNEAPLNVPQQWNEAMYARPVDATTENTEYASPYNPVTNNALYSKPTPRHLRQKPLPKEPTYATVGESGPTYAQVVPKSLRGQVKPIIAPKPVCQTVSSNASMSFEESPYAEIPTSCHYAELSIKPHPSEVSPIESPYAEVTSTESPYAEVTSTESLYAEVTSTESPYAEVTSTESPYAEVTSTESPYGEVTSIESPYAEVTSYYNN